MKYRGFFGRAALGVAALALITTACTTTPPTTPSGDPSTPVASTPVDDSPKVVDGKLQPLNDGWPNAPITLWCAYPAGHGNDLMNKVISEIASEISPVRVNSDVYQTGPNGEYEIVDVLKKRPNGEDGNHLFAINWLALGLRPYTMEALKDAQLEDLDIVTAVVYTPFVFAVPKDAPWNTLEELAAWGREHPGEMRVVASGTGSGVHIAVMAWAAANDVEIRFIPTDGTGESKTVMLGGGADLAAFSYQLGAEDSFKLLALTGSERLSIIPDVPTLEELGFNIPSGNLTGYGTVPGVPEAHKAWLLEMFKLSIADERFQSAYSETSDIRAWNPQDVRDYEVQQLKTVHPLLEELGLATRPLDR